VCRPIGGLHVSFVHVGVSSLAWRESIGVAHSIYAVHLREFFNSKTTIVQE
jgi:hypothetical protein